MGEAAPATTTDLRARMQGVLATFGEQFGVPVQEAKLLRLHSNAIFALPSQGLVVRIATNPTAWSRVQASITATRWLAEHGFCCTVPVADYAQPATIQEHAVSVWRYEQTVPDSPPAMAELGGLLGDLHAQPLPPNGLPELRDPFTSVAEALEAHPEAMADADRDWLTGRITELRQQWNELVFPHPFGLVHGDAHPNNLMRRTSGVVILGDWDQVCRGPREWDLAQVHYTHRRFGRPDAGDLDRCAQSYGWDVRDWNGLETMIRAREVRGLSAFIRTAAAKQTSRNELTHRIETLRRGATTARWSPPTPQ